ncbi:MAG: helix-turn-helix domain-containing protein, partial [Candidatus Promineifilaceae bacterium]
MTRSSAVPHTFAAALRFYRKRTRLTQDALGRAVGYSREQIARLENGSRQPDITAVTALFVPALNLNTPEGEQLLHLAQQARNGRSPTPRYQPPAPLVPLIGRQTELQQLTHLLGQTRLLTLVGAPGIGKTRLALEVAQQ